MKIGRWMFGGLLIFSIALVSWCTIRRINVRDTLANEDLKEVRLGDSNYYLSIPQTYIVQVSKGPDFDVYSFSSDKKAGEPTFSGNIYLGNWPSLINPLKANCKTERLTGKIMGKECNWTLNNCSEQYLLQTIVSNKFNEGWDMKIHMFARATSRSDVDKLVAIYSTLRKQPK
jgi:hypothetical protein